MCIIITKNAGYKMPEKTTLQTCFEHNPDGAGFMWSDANGVHIRKGYKTFDAFYKALNVEIKDAKSAPVVLHFRISTQGGTKAELCHPYPLTSNMDSMRKLSVVCNIGVAHNGVIPLTSDGAKDYNDTMLYIQKYLTLLVKTPLYYKSKELCEIIGETIGASRLAILSNDGHIERIGEGWIVEEKNGVAYSNTSYLPYTARCWNWSSQKGFSYNYDWEDDDDYKPATAYGYNWSDYNDDDGKLYDSIAYVSQPQIEYINEDGKPVYEFYYYGLYDCDGDILDYYETDEKYNNASDVVQAYRKKLRDPDAVREVAQGAQWL